MAKYIVDGSLNHDGVTYAHGSEFETEDEALVKALRKAGTLKLPSELMPAEDIQAELERLRAENEALRVAQQSQQQDSQQSADGSDGEPPKSGEEN